MDVTGLIDNVVSYTDNMPSVDGDTTDNRARLLTYLIAVLSFVWFFREWWWRRTSTIVVVANGDGKVPLPAGFESLSFTGGVYRVSDGQRIDYVSPQELTDINESGYTTATPECWSVYEQDNGSTSATWEPYLHIPTNSAAVSLKLWIDQDPPTLDETTNVDNLKAIPARYHQLVLVPGVRAMAQESKNDLRYRAFQDDPAFMAGLKKMVATEIKGRPTLKKLPSFFGGNRNGEVS